MTETYAHSTGQVDPVHPAINSALTSVPQPADDDIPDFTRKRKPVRFRLNGRVFTAVPAVPAQIMIDFAGKFSGMDPATTSPEQQLAAFGSVLELVLPAEELTAFNTMMRDMIEPVDMEQVDEIISYLFERYGMRPTPQPGDSSPGLPAPEYGTASTDSVQAVVSIPLHSPSTAS